MIFIFTFSLLWSLLPFVFIIIHYYYKSRIKEYDNNLLYFRRGIQCYSCSTHIITDLEECFSRLDSEIEDLNQCSQCHRDMRLKSLLGHFSPTLIKDKIDRFILSKKSEFIMMCFVFLSLFCFIPSLFIHSLTLTHFLSFLNSTLLNTYWVSMIYRVWLCRK